MFSTLCQKSPLLWRQNSSDVRTALLSTVPPTTQKAEHYFREINFLKSILDQPHLDCTGPKCRPSHTQASILIWILPISCNNTSESGSRNKCVRSSLSSSCHSCRTQQCLKWISEISDSYILISNYDLQPQIIFCLSLGYLAMKCEAERQKPSSQEPGWCFRAEGSRK